MHNDAIFNGLKSNCKLYSLSHSSFILEAEGGSTLYLLGRPLETNIKEKVKFYYKFD